MIFNIFVAGCGIFGTEFDFGHLCLNFRNIFFFIYTRFWMLVFYEL